MQRKIGQLGGSVGRAGADGGGAKAPFPSHLTRVEMDRICVEIQYVNQCPNISEYAMKG